MQLTIHRGSKQIGGSCVEISAGKTRIIVDVGLPLDDLNDKNSAKPRLQRGQPIPAGLAPVVDGLFAAGQKVDAIFLSHAHADHSGLLSRTQPEIPIYLTKGTSKMLLAGSIFAGQPEVPRVRQRSIKAGKPISIGDLTVTPYSVDHSTFDCVALLIESEGKRILYSGDLRLHGRKPGMARRLIQVAKAAPVDVLVMEGTHFSAHRQRGTSEVGLETAIRSHVRSSKGLVFAVFSPMHVDRLVSFYKAAKRCGRTFVVDPYGAFVLHLISSQCRIPKPGKAAKIRVFHNAYFEQTLERRNLGKIRDLFSAARIEKEDILRSPGEYVMLFRPSMLDHDFDGALPPASLCLYSYWNGYLSRPEWSSFKTKLARTGGRFLECHTSGHIFADDIVKFVNSLNPKRVVPIHTEAPEQFKRLFANTELLQDGVSYCLKTANP